MADLVEALMDDVIGGGLRKINRALFTDQGLIRPELSEQAVRQLLGMFNAMRAAMGLFPLDLGQVTT